MRPRDCGRLFQSWGLSFKAVTPIVIGISLNILKSLLSWNYLSLPDWQYFVHMWRKSIKSKVRCLSRFTVALLSPLNHLETVFLHWFSLVSLEAAMLQHVRPHMAWYLSFSSALEVPDSLQTLISYFFFLFYFKRKLSNRSFYGGDGRGVQIWVTDEQNNWIWALIYKLWHITSHQNPQYFD